MEGGDADTYFELNKRQAGLNRLREATGPNPPAAVRADLDEIQKRFDANRILLNERAKIADRQVTEILRAGAGPIDVAAGGINVLFGEGEFRDYLSVVGAIPLAGSVQRMGELAKAAWAASGAAEGASSKLIQLGGAYRDIKGLPGYEAHHMPGNVVSPLSTGDGPAIAMLKDDHRALLTSRGGKDATAFRVMQSEHIARGDFASAINMEIEYIRSIFGKKYDDAMEQVVRHSRDRGIIE